MKIVKAMKKVARLKGEIRELKKRMESCLNTLSENDFDENFSYLEQELNIKIGLLIELKTKIMCTNVNNNMFSVIVNLGELKSYMEFLKELHPKIGKQSTSRFSDESDVYKSQINIQMRNERIQSCQDEINNLTDKLDEFNAVTNIADLDVETVLFE
jgi:hypothetical protein